MWTTRSCCLRLCHTALAFIYRALTSVASHHGLPPHTELLFLRVVSRTGRLRALATSGSSRSSGSCADADQGFAIRVPCGGRITQPVA